MRRHRWRQFGVLDTPAMEHYFEKMAARGWMLKDGNGGHWVFERQAPRDIRFSVAVLGDVSLWAKNDNKQSEEFRFYCESAGWHFLLADKSMQVLWSEDKDLLPVETDEGLKFEMAQKQYRKLLTAVTVILFCCFLMAFFPFSFMGMVVVRILATTMLESNGGIAAAVLLFGCILWGTGNVIFYLIWSRLSRRRLEKGQQVWYFTYPWFCVKETGSRLYLLFAFFLLYLFGVRENFAEKNWMRLMGMLVNAGGITASALLGLRMRKKGIRWYYAALIVLLIFTMERGTSYFYSRDFSKEKMETEWMAGEGPFLTPEDLLLSWGKEMEFYSERNTSFLLDKEYYSSRGEEGYEADFSYTLYQSDSHAILKWIKEGTDKNAAYRQTGDWWEENIHVYAYFYNDVMENVHCVMILRNGSYMLEVQYRLREWSMDREAAAKRAAEKMRELPGIL